MNLPCDPKELTAEWLDDVLAEVPAFRGATYQAVRPSLIGEGFGLSGTVVCLDLKASGPGTPASIVAKFAKAGPGRDEIRFYELIAPRVPIRLAVFHAGRVDEEADRAILLLEHISPAKQGDVLRGASEEQALALARVAARLHAEFMGGEDPVLSELTVWTARADSIAGQVEERLGRFITRHRAGLPDRQMARVKALPVLLDEAESDLADCPATLIHGDLHLDNVLFPPSGDPVILDWPDARRGPAVMDFVRLLVEGMTVDFRRRHEARVLEAYAGARREAGQPLPPPDRWRRQMRSAVIWHLAYAVAWAGAEDPGYDMPRVREIVHSLVRQSAAAAVDHIEGL